MIFQQKIYAGLRKKVSIQTFQKLKRAGTPITVMTAHDYPSGLLADKSGMDMCLVGDSLAMIALGYDSTNMITLDVSLKKWEFLFLDS